MKIVRTPEQEDWIAKNQLCTTDEILYLAASQRAGYFIRSGRKLSLYFAFKHWCQRLGYACVIGIRNKRDSVVEVDGRETWRGPAEALEQVCRRIAEQHRPTQPSLFAEVDP